MRWKTDLKKKWALKSHVYFKIQIYWNSNIAHPRIEPQNNLKKFDF